jgi:hypothetical protein
MALSSDRRLDNTASNAGSAIAPRLAGPKPKKPYRRGVYYRHRRSMRCGGSFCVQARQWYWLGDK